jgi:hypothetical protein
MALEFPERAAAKQRAVGPEGPERDFGLAQGVEVQRMYALRRGDRLHAPEVFLEECADFRTGEVVAANEHLLRVHWCEFCNGVTRVRAWSSGPVACGA